MGQFQALKIQGGSAPFFGGEKIAGKRTEMVLRDAGSDIQCGGRTNHHLPQYAGGTWMADTLPIFVQPEDGADCSTGV